MEGRTARRPPVNGTSPKTSSAGLVLLLLAKKEHLTPADWRLASSLRRAPGVSYISPVSVIFVRQYSRKLFMVMVFKANF